MDERMCYNANAGSFRKQSSSKSPPMSIREVRRLVATAVPIRLRVAPFPHASACLFTVLAILSITQAIIACGPHPVHGWVWMGAALTSFGIAVFAEADAASRLREYQRLLRLLRDHGWQERFVRPIAASRCQRDAAAAAAATAGCRREINALFRRMGYRWYHLLPDAVFHNPRYLATGRFLRCAFFVRYARKAAAAEKTTVRRECPQLIRNT